MIGASNVLIDDVWTLNGLFEHFSQRIRTVRFPTKNPSPSAVVSMAVAVIGSGVWQFLTIMTYVISPGLVFRNNA